MHTLSYIVLILLDLSSVTLLCSFFEFLHKMYTNIAKMQYMAIFEVAICNIKNRHIVSALIHTYKVVQSTNKSTKLYV